MKETTTQALPGIDLDLDNLESAIRAAKANNASNWAGYIGMTASDALALIAQARAAQQAQAESLGPWYAGEPPFPQNQEWFIAETIYGDRVVLKALPEGYTYDYKTADETYMARRNVKRWMQFPDSEFIPPSAAQAAVPVAATLDELSALDANPLYEALKLALGNLALHDHKEAERIGALARAAASQAAPAEQSKPKLPEGWVPLSIIYNDDMEYPEEVAYGPPIMMNRLGKWLDKFLAQEIALRDGMVLAPHFRGYAHLGIGAYVINHSAKGETAELVISVATEEEKAGRTVGDLRDNASNAVVQPDAMAVRLRFENVAGLDALEQQLRFVRTEHFADATLAPAQPAGAADTTASASDAMKLWDSLPDAKMPEARATLAPVAAQQGAAKAPAAQAVDARNHDVADRLSLWLSSSMDDHLRQDEYRKHIRAWLDFDNNGAAIATPASTPEASQQAAAVAAPSEDQANAIKEVGDKMAGWLFGLSQSDAIFASWAGTCGGLVREWDAVVGRPSACRCRAPGGVTSDKDCSDAAAATSEDARDAALEQAAREVEKRFIGYRDDDADLREIATSIRALKSSMRTTQQEGGK